MLLTDANTVAGSFSHLLLHIQLDLQPRMAHWHIQLDLQPRMAHWHIQLELQPHMAHWHIQLELQPRMARWHIQLELQQRMAHWHIQLGTMAAYGPSSEEMHPRMVTILHIYILLKSFYPYLYLPLPSCHTSQILLALPLPPSSFLHTSQILLALPLLSGPTSQILLDLPQPPSCFLPYLSNPPSPLYTSLSLYLNSSHVLLTQFYRSEKFFVNIQLDKMHFNN